MISKRRFFRRGVAKSIGHGFEAELCNRRESA
jgi:hypothetical protein